MKKFVAGALLSALLILGGQKLISENEVKTTSKDSITVKVKDQIIELPDTVRKDSVK